MRVRLSPRPHRWRRTAGSLGGMTKLRLPVLDQLTTSPERANDVYNRLLKERIIFLGSEVDDSSANLICAQLILLAAEDEERDIYLYVNSPGGSVTAGLAIYDTMQYVACDVASV